MATAALPLASRYETISLFGCCHGLETWIARERVTGRQVTLRQPAPGYRHLPAVGQLLINEADVLKQVRSPHVLPLLADFSRDAERMIVRDGITGVRVSDYVAARGLLDPCEALWLARQAAQGLLALRQAGFLHGDVKPENLILRDEGLVQWINLGFARPIGTEPREVTLPCEDSQRHTDSAWHEDSRRGASRATTVRFDSDRRAFGVLLYRLLTGRLPGSETPDIADSEAPQMLADLVTHGLRYSVPGLPREVVQSVRDLISPGKEDIGWHLDTLVQQLVRWELLLWPCCSDAA